MNAPEKTHAVCPFFGNIIHNGKAQTCRDDADVLPYEFITMNFKDGKKRREWNEDFCNDVLYRNCPIYRLLEEETL